MSDTTTSESDVKGDEKEAKEEENKSKPESSEEPSQPPSKENLEISDREAGDRNSAPTTKPRSSTTRTRTSTIKREDGSINYPTHDFQYYTFLKPTYCSECAYLLIGLTHQGLKCLKCSKVVHAHECKKKATRCSPQFDEFRLDMPNCVEPLIVLVNTRSGGQQGVKLKTDMMKLLSPEQVFDLSDGGPKVALEAFSENGKYSRCKLLVCGGDGTVGWVLSVMDDLNYENEPAVGVLPLGTGNDLARSLGWGGGYNGCKVWKVINKLFRCRTVPMDRWTIQLGTQNPKRMNNYFSIGADARIALHFHNAREKNPEKFTSREGNKFWYFKFSFNAFIGKPEPIDGSVKVEADGKEIELPKSTEGLIVINLPSYAAGADVWGKPQGFLPQSFQDGLLEVCTVSGVAHLGQIQTGLTTALPLCQCKQLKIKVENELPMQLDGEPWLQPPTEINISFLRKSPMIQYGGPIEEMAEVSDITQYKPATESTPSPTKADLSD